MSTKEAIIAYSDMSSEVFGKRKIFFQDGYYKATNLEKAVKKVVRMYGENYDEEEDMLDSQDHAEVCKA
jgi:hypothetical protein